MADFYFYTFLGLLVVGLLPLLVKGTYVYEYPGFMTITFGVFILPQAISLLRFPGAAPEESVASVLLMVCLCLLACLIGYRLPAWRYLSKLTAAHAKEGALLVGGCVLMVTSAYFNYLISQMSEEQTGGSMWTGRVTIYLFFTGGTFLATAIFLRCVLIRKSPLALCLFVISTLSPLQAAIFAGRRENAAQLLLAIGLVFLFEKGLKPPRLLVAGLAVAAMLLIPATGTYRGIAASGEWEALKELDLVEDFQEFVNKESNLELRLAAVSIYSTQALNDYAYGIGYWDEMVWRFVPGQIVGVDLKRSLMFRRGAADLDESEMAARVATIGTTQTGMADSFEQFGYFGALFFAVIAVFYKSIWLSATREGAVFAQLFYIGTVTSAMRAVTHQTSDWLPGVVYQLIFLSVLYVIAHKRTPRSDTFATPLRRIRQS